MLHYYFFFPFFQAECVMFLQKMMNRACVHLFCRLSSAQRCEMGLLQGPSLDDVVTPLTLGRCGDAAPKVGGAALAAHPSTPGQARSTRLPSGFILDYGRNGALTFQPRAETF